MSCSANAQNVNIDFLSGSTNSYNMNDVRKITLGVTDLELHLWDGTTNFWNYNIVDRIYYTNLSVGTDENAMNMNRIGLNLYPNPSDDILNVEYILSSEVALVA